MRILLCGDVVGRSGREAVTGNLPGLRDRYAIDFVVVNGESQISRAIGAYYAKRRGVPERNLFAVELPLVDPSLTTQRHQTISRAGFERELRDPIAAHLQQHDPDGRIRILVTTKGVPLRIDDPDRRTTAFSQRTWASVDAELPRWLVLLLVRGRRPNRWS